MNTLNTSDDLTIINYTANLLHPEFAHNTQQQLLRAIGDAPLIVVSHKPIDLGDEAENIVVDMPRHHLSIYKQALIGADAAKTKYIAMAEDDVLYSPAHFRHRPSPGKFAYNIGFWGVYTWRPEFYSWKGRRNLCMMICERDLFIDAMTERFLKWPKDEEVNIGHWAEPGKYERQLGVTPRETETFFTDPPNVMFSHYEALQYDGLGERKRVGELRAFDIPYWGDIVSTAKLYKKAENKNEI